MIRYVLPALMITLTSFLCPNLKGSAVNVPFRPPSWVFAVVWPMLYITTGYAWYNSKLDYAFISLISLCCTWLVLYSCVKMRTFALLNLITASITSWFIAYALKTTNNIYFILPICVWLTFATSIGISELYLYE